MANTNSKLIAEIHEAWATAHGYRDKPQAASIKPEELHAVNTTSFKHQAASKLQASSPKRIK